MRSALACWGGRLHGGMGFILYTSSRYGRVLSVGVFCCSININNTNVLFHFSASTVHSYTVPTLVSSTPYPFHPNVLEVLYSTSSFDWPVRIADSV